MLDSSLFIKRATITALKAAEGVTDLVPEERVYPMQRPAKLVWPWIGYGVPVVEPFTASCLNGAAVNVPVHAFAETTGTGNATQSGEDEAHKIAAAITTALDGEAIDLEPHGAPYPATAHFIVTGTQVVADNAEATRFHAIVSLRIVVSS